MLSCSCDFLIVSLCDFLIVSLCDFLIVSLYDFLIVSLCDFLVVSLCDFLIVSLCDFLIVSLCDFLVVSLCDFLIVSLCDFLIVSLAVVFALLSVNFSNGTIYNHYEMVSVYYLYALISTLLVLQKIHMSGYQCLSSQNIWQCRYPLERN